ncbi:MAG: hypothetical protein QNJ37_06185 [Crocosphaera sp.]|nr:hypothetical protein [Crocosphaera sp.]
MTLFLKGSLVEVIVLVESSDEEDKTEYLLRSQANKKQLLDALENVKQGQIVSVNLDEYEKSYFK